MDVYEPKQAESEIVENWLGRLEQDSTQFSEVPKEVGTELIPSHSTTAVERLHNPLNRSDCSKLEVLV